MKGDHGQQLAIYCLHRLLGLVGEDEDRHGQKFSIVIIYTHMEAEENQETLAMGSIPLLLDTPKFLHPIQLILLAYNFSACRSAPYTNNCMGHPTCILLYDAVHNYLLPSHQIYRCFGPLQCSYYQSLSSLSVMHSHVQESQVYTHTRAKTLSFTLCCT